MKWLESEGIVAIPVIGASGWPLINYDEFTKSIAVSLKDDSDAKIREVAYWFLCIKGETFDVEELFEKVPNDYAEGLGIRVQDWESVTRSAHTSRDSLILRMYSDEPAERLLALIKWDSLDGHLAYEALTIYRFDIIENRLRSDLKDHFNKEAEQFAKEEEKKMDGSFSDLDFWRSTGSKYGPLVSHFMRPDNDLKLTPEALAKSSAEEQRKKYIKAALSGLVRHGVDTDIEYGRMYLSYSDDEVQVEAIRLIERFGDKRDAKSLIETVRGIEGKIRELAAQVAVKLDPGSNGIAKTFMKTKDGVFVRAALQSFLSIDDEPTISNFLLDYLFEDDNTRRQMTLAYFIEKYSGEELEQLLRDYTNSQKAHYYDVISTLDRVLYAPSPFKEEFRRRAVEILYQRPSRPNVNYRFYA